MALRTVQIGEGQVRLPDTVILMRGDEHGLGTPDEYMASLVAVAGLDEVPQRLVAGPGFGVGAYHGVSHSLVLGTSMRWPTPSGTPRVG